MKIRIKNLDKAYGKNVIFNNLNFEIPSQGIVCIHGSSGCGKTTLLNMIGFLEEYDSGKILYDGKEVRKQDRRMMLQRHIGFIFQDFGLIENETVKDNMMIVGKIRKMKNVDRKIDRKLNEVGLHHMLNRKVYELSGGEQQRVAIAKIALKNPDVILADEPTASLDADNKGVILNLLRKFANEGKTVIIVSHDIDVIQFADYTIDLNSVKAR